MSDERLRYAIAFEAARLMSGINLPYTVLFAAWDEEERGLYGSQAYADTAATFYCMMLPGKAN